MIDGVSEVCPPNDEVREVSIVTCKCCKVTMNRYLSGKYPDKRNKKWVDENGREFSGTICPTCHVKRVALRNRNRRKLRKMLKEIGGDNSNES